MKVIFRNKASIDPRSITTFGVSAKETNSPIGYFGTGLKYAIAVLVRNNISIKILSNGEEYSFIAEDTTIRGEEFRLVCMVTRNPRGEEKHQELGFTTELGKNWSVENAFREIYSNMLDEGGSCEESESDPAVEDGTAVIVDGEDFHEAFKNKSNVFLEVPIVTSLNKVDVHSGHSTSVFYRGVRVQDLRKYTLFTYNITNKVELTEDRTLKYNFYFTDALKESIAACQDQSIIESVLFAGPDFLESDLDFSDVGFQPSDAFMQVVAKFSFDKSDAANQSMIALYNKFCEKAEDIVQSELNAVEVKQLEAAKAFVKNVLGVDVSGHPIVVVDSLGGGVLGLAENDKCFLAKRLFLQGTKQVAAAIYEEFLHLDEGFSDCSRSMQNYLFDKICSLGEQLTGDPL